MTFQPNGFDLWAFHREDHVPKYLLLRSSQQKADKWFRGGRFWQIPSDFVEENETVVQALQRELQRFGLEASSLWAAEHAYTFYNPRYEAVILITVYAAEVQSPKKVKLKWEHSEYDWMSAERAEALLHFRGLKEGLHWVRRYVSEPERASPELQLL